MILGKSQNTAFRVCCFLVILACGVLQLRFSIQEQNIFSGKTDQKSTTWIRNARILTFHAKQKYMFEADMGAAKMLLQQALTSNPYYVPAWLSLAELDNDIGKKQQAYAVLNYVDSLTRDLKRWRWDKVLVAYQLGKTDMLPSELSYILREIPGKTKANALQLAFSLWEEPEDLIRNAGRENITHFFNYAIDKKFPQKALFFWHMIESEGQLWQEKQALAFLDMLLKTGEIEAAGNIWRKHFNSDHLLFNGDFSQPFLQHAFGWRGKKDKNFEQRFIPNSGEGSERTLHYRFKGWDNLNFHHLYQVVPVEGGKKYTCTTEFKSQGLTTDQRPFLEVYGYDKSCKVPYVTTEMVAADEDWSIHDVIFDVPEKCTAVVIRLRRRESRHIDNKLVGQMWLRNLVIRKTDEDSKLLD